MSFTISGSFSGIMNNVQILFIIMKNVIFDLCKQLWRLATLWTTLATLWTTTLTQKAILITLAKLVQNSFANKECLSALCSALVTHGFLLCLEWLDANWLSSCVCLEALHSDCFCCMWFLLYLEIVHSHWMSASSSPAGGSIFVVPTFWLAEWFAEGGGLHVSNFLK